MVLIQGSNWLYIFKPQLVIVNEEGIMIFEYYTNIWIVEILAFQPLH